MSQDKTPTSDVSPRSQPPKADYFDIKQPAAPLAHEQHGPVASPEPIEPPAQAQPVLVLDDPHATPTGSKDSVDLTGEASATTTNVETASSNGSQSEPPSRKQSVSSVSFLFPTDPSLPKGSRKPHRAGRIRDSSPAHPRFESHVAFDNIPLGDSTSYNPLSFTLNVRHAGFQYRRRHRTFMVGVDDNAYSDHALQWLLDELVDDGDEIVCIRVLETPPRSQDKTYQEDAKVLMDHIQAKNTQNRAIGLVLEYAVGKLHSTFQHLIKMYQPSMLVVGTKGRSLDGVQGFLVNRSSFSKYCLQYSPVPVVVVRPTEKREKKKAKRAGDPARQSYIQMLAGMKHEADSENNSVYEWEPKITADEEAHRVAMAVGLPAAYDPTIKPIDPSKVLANRRSASGTRSRDSSPAPPLKSTPPPTKKSDNAEESDSEYEEDFEVTAGDQLLKKEILHKMEHNEGAALKAETHESSTDSDDESPGSGGVKTSS